MKRSNAQIVDYLNGHLSECARRRIEVRLAEDPSFRAEVARLSNEMRYLRELSRDPEREARRATLDQDLLQVFAQTPPVAANRFRPRRLLMALAGIVWLTLLGGFYFWSGHGPKQETVGPAAPLAKTAPGTDSIQVVLETEDPRIQIYWIFEKNS